MENQTVISIGDQVARKKKFHIKCNIIVTAILKKWAQNYILSDFIAILKV